MEKISEVKNNVNCINTHIALTSQEIEQVNQSLDYLKKLKELYCTNCKYCSGCPKNIQIGDIFNSYIYYNVYELKDTAKKLYLEATSDEKGKIEDCIECGLCENKCPQKIHIIEDLKKVKKLFDEVL